MSFVVPAEPATRAAAVKQYFDDARQAQAGRLKAGASGADVARALAQSAEDVVRGLWWRAQPPGHAPAMLVVVLGGLGRHELGPYSDLDVLLVTDAPEHPAVRA